MIGYIVPIIARAPRDASGRTDWNWDWCYYCATPFYATLVAKLEAVIAKVPF